MVGKDVGLGMPGTSTVSGGLRVAQFTSNRTVHMSGVPDLQYGSGPLTSFAAKYEFLNTPRIWHHFTGDYQGKASFLGLGPEFNWKASTPLAGTDAGDGEITVDWGLNAGLLFGRQKAIGAHMTESTRYNCAFGSRETGPNPKLHLEQWVNCNTTATSANGPHNRSRFVTVPNLGGFAGLSIHYRNAKVSFGYRADHFFGAIDGGIDSHKSYDRGMYGPFATISLGLGG
jgi:hypothetical protein